MQAWPQGIDDGTDDDNIHLPEKEKKDEKEEVLRFVNKGRQWKEGTWPVHHTWDKDWTWATQQN